MASQCISYALGNLEVRCECMTWFFVKTDMVAKGISQDDIPDNLGWEMG